MLTISHDPKNSEFREVIAVDKIVRLSKLDAETTLIHLTTGEIIESESSIRTLEARLNLAGIEITGREA